MDEDEEGCARRRPRSPARHKAHVGAVIGVGSRDLEETYMQKLGRLGLG